MGQPKRTIAEIVILKPTAAENEAVKAAIEAATTVGEKLAGARNARGLTLQDAYLATKVKVAQLAAIEAGDRSSLPAVPFTAGFIKAYAQYLGLDPDDYAKAYRIEVGAAPKPDAPRAELEAPGAPAIVAPVAETPPAAFLPAPAAPAPAIAEVKADSAAIAPPTPQFVASPPAAPVAAPAPDRFPLYVGAAAVAICAAWMGFNTMNANKPAPAPVAAVDARPTPAAIDTAPAAPAIVEATPTPANEAGEQATAKTTIEMTAATETLTPVAIAPPVVKPRPKPQRVAEATPAPVMIAPEPEAPAIEPVEETVAAAPQPAIVAATLSRPASPQYPDRCSRGARSEEQVSVVFDITVEGRPTNISAADSTNACFNGAAIDAASRMRFTPRTSDGKPIMEFAKRLTVRFPK